MPKKIDEMTAAGSGATIGPIMPAGGQMVKRKLKADKERVQEMLGIHRDIRPADLVVFNQNAHPHLREDFEYYARVYDFDKMADLVREEVTRQAIRTSIEEVVRKKDGKFVLYAPNTGKKHDAKPVAVFTTKLAAKRAELAKFPPKDPKKLARLKKQIEKLMKDPKARAKEIMMKEMVDRDLFERAILSLIVTRDAQSSLLKEGASFGDSRPKPDEYTSFVKRLSRKAIDRDPTFKGHMDDYKNAADAALTNAAQKLSGELGFEVKVLGEPKKHRDGKIYAPALIRADGAEVPIYIYADGPKVKIRKTKDTRAALTQCAPELADKIRARVEVMNEEETPDDPLLSKAYGKMVDSTKDIAKFIDAFLTKLSPAAMTMLKQKLAKKFMALGKSGGGEPAPQMAENVSRVDVQVDRDQEMEARRHGFIPNRGMLSLSMQDAQKLLQSLSKNAEDPLAARGLAIELNSRLGKGVPSVRAVMPRHGNPSDPLDVEIPASNHPGAAEARRKEVSTNDVPDLMSQDDFDKMYSSRYQQE